MPRPENTACPRCGHIGLEVAAQLTAQPLGSFSLAGAQTKVSARRELSWTCPDCGAHAPAEANDGAAERAALDGDDEDHPQAWDALDPTTGTPRVLNRKCATCVYRTKKSPVDTERREQMVAEAAETNTAIICHSTLPYWDYGATEQALCRGYWDVPADSDRSFRVRMLRSGRWGEPVFVDPPEGA